MHTGSGELPLSTLLRPLRALWRTLSRFVEAIGYTRRMYREYLALSALSDVELNDIGIARRDLAVVLLRAPHRPRVAPEFPRARALRARTPPKAPSQLSAPARQRDNRSL